MSAEIDPNELVRIIGELEVVRRLQEARIAELEQALAIAQGDPAMREEQECR